MNGWQARSIELRIKIEKDKMHLHIYMFTTSTIHNVARGEKRERQRQRPEGSTTDKYTDSFLFVFLLVDWPSFLFPFLFGGFLKWAQRKENGLINSDYPQIREYDLKGSSQPFPRSCCRRRKPPLLELYRSPNPQAVEWLHAPPGLQL